MKMNSIIALLVTAGSVALFPWSHVKSRIGKSVVSAAQVRPLDHVGSLSLQGAIGPAITTPITERVFELTVPLDSPVSRGQMIGFGKAGGDTVELQRIRQELEVAALAVSAAEGQVRWTDGELQAAHDRLADLNGQEEQTQAEEREVEYAAGSRGALPASRPAKRLDAHSQAERSPAEGALESIRFTRLQTTVEMDAIEARARAARAELRNAKARRSAAESILWSARTGEQGGRIAAPASGLLVASERLDGTALGIASDPGKLAAFVLARTADIGRIQLGQEALITSDDEPSWMVHGRVSAISEAPFDRDDGGVYQVAVVVEHYSGVPLLGEVAIHAHIARVSR